MTRKIFALLLAACLGLALYACGNGAGQAGAVVPEEIDIAISGLPEGEVILTGAQLRNDFEITELDAVSINSKGVEKQVHARGVLLETVLNERGASLADFDSAVASAADGYMIAIPESVLHGRDILLAFETNGEEIQPRIVVPGERAMYWVKQLCSIELIKLVAEEPVTREVDLGELIERLKDQAQPYEHKEEDCLAIPMALLLAEIDAGEAQFVTIRSADGLTKTEKYDTFAGQFLVIEGTPDAPLYTGADLPAGMRLKNVANFQVGGVLVK